MITCVSPLVGASPTSSSTSPSSKGVGAHPHSSCSPQDNLLGTGPSLTLPVCRPVWKAPAVSPHTPASPQLLETAGPHRAHWLELPPHRSSVRVARHSVEAWLASRRLPAKSSATPFCSCPNWSRTRSSTRSAPASCAGPSWSRTQGCAWRSTTKTSPAVTCRGAGRAVTTSAAGAAARAGDGGVLGADRSALTMGTPCGRPWRSPASARWLLRSPRGLECRAQRMRPGVEQRPTRIRAGRRTGRVQRRASRRPWWAPGA